MREDDEADMNESTKKNAFAKFTTLDIVLMAMLAAANAVMTVYLSPVNQALNGLGGPIATSTITGLYMITDCWPITLSASRGQG